MAEFKPIKVPLSEVDTLPIVEGQFIATTDTSYIFVDISSSERRRYNEITVISEADRQSMLAPIEGFYFTSDITNLWYCKDGEWTNITNASHPFDKTNPHKTTAAQVGLSKVENKSSAEILDLITQELIIAKLGYTPPRQDTTYEIATGNIAGIVKSGGDIMVAVNGAMFVTSVDWSKIKNVPDIFAPSEHTHTKAQILDFPSSMPASDVSAWAKAATKPTYNPTEVGVISTAPVSGQVAVFDGTTGKIKSTGFTIAKSVPSNAIFTDTVYKHPEYVAKTSGLYKITVDSLGHVSAVTAVTKADITNLGIPSQDTNTTYGLATDTTNGLIRIGYVTSGKNYPVSLDNEGKAYVNVPWTDNNTTYAVGTASTLGLTKLYTGTGTATDGTMTQSAINTALSGKAASSHTHDDRYYTETEINTKFNSINPSTITDGYTSKSFYLNTHPENSGVLIPFVNNDIAFLLKRGGSAKVMYDGVEKTLDLSNIFDGSPSYWSINPTGITEIVIELTLHQTFTWTNTLYIDFGAAAWRAKNIKFDVMNTNAGETTWSNKATLTNYALGHYKVGMSHNQGTGFNKIKITLSSWSNASNFRIAAIGVLNYGSFGMREVFVPRDGGIMYGGLTPRTNNTIDLGTSANQWRNIYGNLVGNASTATKATQDSAGQQINTTYIKGLSISGKTITYTRGDGTTGTITTQDTNTTYSTATASTLGLIKIGYAVSGKNYPVVLDSDGKAYVNVPWTDNNTVYTHPTTAGNKHIPAGGASGQILRWSADGTAVWGSDNNTTYNIFGAASASAAGSNGLVPAPAAGKQTSFLRGDGTWVIPTNTTYGLATVSANGLLSSVDFTKISKFTVSEAGYLAGVTSAIQTQLNGKAATSHGTHVTYATEAPKNAGTATVGTSTKVAREDHIHPIQTTVSGNAGTATKLATARKIGNATFDGTSDITLSDIGIGKSAYEAAQAGGYTDTEAKFYTDLAAIQNLAAELETI